jgi:hypothetical protein
MHTRAVLRSCAAAILLAHASATIYLNDLSWPVSAGGTYDVMWSTDADYVHDRAAVRENAF